MKRLLTISHSYVVALNRRLAHEMALSGKAVWEVTAVAPLFHHGDLRRISLEEQPHEACHVKPLSTRFSKQIHLMYYSRGLRDLLRQKWEMVHCWEEPYVFAGSQIARWTPQQTPLVFATYQNIEKKYPPPFNYLERYCLRRSTGWISSGKTSENTLLRQPSYAGLPHRMIPMGVDTKTFTPSKEMRGRTRLSLQWDRAAPPVIGYLGRFVPEKGVRFLTKILDRLKSPWRALFVGGGPLEEYLKKWSAPYQDRVRIVTGVPHDKVPAYLNAMDLLCAPSQTTPHWKEQFGRMLIEAFACGVPVLASDSGEIPHVVGNIGAIVKEDDASAWREQIESLLESPKRRAEMSSEGRQAAQNNYAWPVIARRHLDFFEDLSEAR